MINFINKSVIVTGSSIGIGKAIALAFLQHGANVVINGRDLEKLIKTREEFRNLGYDPVIFQGDVTDPQVCGKLVREAIKHFKRLDCLINNVGLPTRGRFELLSPDLFRKVIESNLMSAVYCTQAALSEIKATKGSIIFISTLAAIHGIPNTTPYNIGKMGLTSLAQSLRVELHDAKVHIGVLYVGLVENYPGRKVLNFDGSLVLVKRQGHQSSQEVASAVIKMISKRKSIMVLTPLGKLLCFMDWLAPALVHYILVKTQFSKQYQ